MSTPYRRRRRWLQVFTVDSRPGCGVCLDFGHLENLGPCLWCDPDSENEHHLQVAADIAAVLGDAA